MDSDQWVEPAGFMLCHYLQGEVKSSAGGGSSVVFTEVETLKQTSPGDRLVLSD